LFIAGVMEILAGSIRLRPCHRDLKDFMDILTAAALADVSRHGGCID
jgi:hypothetical protein